jgi:hypothetical protein
MQSRSKRVGRTQISWRKRGRGIRQGRKGRELKRKDERKLYWKKRALGAERKAKRLQKEEEEGEESGEHEKVELIEFIPPHVHPVNRI